MRILRFLGLLLAAFVILPLAALPELGRGIRHVVRELWTLTR